MPVYRESVGREPSPSVYWFRKENCHCLCCFMVDEYHLALI